MPLHSAPPSPALPWLRDLPATHLLRDLVAEHEQMLARLDELDQCVAHYRDALGTPDAREVAARIRAIAEFLIHSEPHHQREEEVLFPELENRGVAMPPRIMRREHVELRACKHALLDAASATHPDSEAIAEAAGTLAAMLRDHILKENGVLYPMALSLIQERTTWEKMRIAAQQFGSCCVACRAPK